MSADRGAKEQRPADSGGDRARDELAAAQAELLAALVAGAPAPAGFDAERVRQQALALLAKRAATASAHHPWLADALDADYLPHFTRYAEGRPKSAGSTSHADAAAFETYLRDTEAMPDRPRRPSRSRPRFRRR